MQERQIKRKAWAIDYLGGHCNSCGSINDLQFDHIDPSTKIIDIPSLYTNSMKIFMEELSKCQLLCVKCHKKKTSLESAKRVTHGKYWAAYKLKCQCSPCLVFRKDYPSSRRKNPKKPPRQCGSYAMYKAGCKCTECKKANTQYILALRAKSKIGLLA